MHDQRSSRDVRLFGWRRLNPADRAFTALVFVALVPVVLLALAGCGVLGFVAYQVSSVGLVGVAGDRQLWPVLTFLAVFLVGVALGGRALLTQLAATRRLERAVEVITLPPTERLAAAAERCRLDDVVLVEAPQPFSFAYGLLGPRVVISTALVDALNNEELAAVLEHERYHVRAFDPLKVVLARAMTAGFFYLPVLRPLRSRYVASREIAADRSAVSAYGRGALAGALVRAVSGPDWANLGAAAALSGTELLEERIIHLETGDEPPGLRLPAAAIATTVAVVAMLAGALLYTVVAAGGPAELMRDRMGGEMEGMAGNGVVPGVIWWVGLAGAGLWLWRKAHRIRG